MINIINKYKKCYFENPIEKKNELVWYQIPSSLEELRHSFKCKVILYNFFCNKKWNTLKPENIISLSTFLDAQTDSEVAVAWGEFW